MPDQPIEDVLASIRRLMLEEQDPPAPAAAAAPEADGEAPHLSAGEADDVLELTEPLAPEPVSPVAAAPSPAMPPEPARPAPRPLVSPGTADASRQALAYLSTLHLKGGEPADDTLPGLVREMLRPMLKAWLDAELPAIVERLVVQELARLEVGKE